MGVEAVGPKDFEDWYREEHPRLLGLLAAATGDADAASEAADEAFSRALANWKRVSNMQSPAGWTYRVALNLVRRSVKRRTRETAGPTGAEEVTAVPATHPEVWDAVRALPLRQREAVLLRYVTDLPEAEIARVMRVRRGTVASSLASARRTLALRLADDVEEEVR
jgi:RNA polymerase sigma-70 factor (ECF subfamily)